MINIESGLLHFHGSEMMHCKIRMLLSHLLLPTVTGLKVLDGDLKNHVKNMQHPTVWGSKVTSCPEKEDYFHT